MVVYIYVNTSMMLSFHECYADDVCHVCTPKVFVLKNDSQCNAMLAVGKSCVNGYSSAFLRLYSFSSQRKVRPKINSS
jgi:hypothetical protein